MNGRLRVVAGVFGWVLLVLTASFVWLSNAEETLAQGQTTFTGNSFRVDNEGVGLSRRGFDAGARTHWHAHGGDQVLFVQEGGMRYQVEGSRMREADLHEIAYLNKGIAHWHGALPDQDFLQVSVTFTEEDAAEFEWFEPVTDEQYNGNSDR